jgi:hypothetical protein
MKNISIIATLALGSSLAFGFDFGALVQQKVGEVVQPKQQEVAPSTSTTSTTKTSSNLSNSTVTSGLKEALKNGVEYGVAELGKDGGYLNNPNVKIPLPKNLAKAETLIRSAGGDKLADDLIKSMNTAATKAAPKTATIFVSAIDKMSVDDAKTILNGNEHAATEYFKKNTTTSLKEMIKPIIQESMQENNVAKYYDTFNDYYGKNAKSLVEDNSIMKMAKGFGADEYLPTSSDATLDDYVTEQAIDGLFKMLANKEADIRKNPLAQTSTLLKEVFGK